MPRRSREHSEATAARVLEVAEELFTRDGYASTGLEAVAAAAGVTRGAVYHHYAGKLALFRAVLHRAQGVVADAVEEAAAGAADPWAALEAGCRAFLTASSAPPVRRVVLVDAPAVLGWQEWRAEDAAQSGRLLLEALTELRHAGLLRDHPVEPAAALLSGAMNEAALWIAARPDPVEATEAVWPALRSMIRALRAG
jgi:AcrR family transcriptional regulator